MFRHFDLLVGACVALMPASTSRSPADNIEGLGNSINLLWKLTPLKTMWLVVRLGDLSGKKCRHLLSWSQCSLLRQWHKYLDTRYFFTNNYTTSSRPMPSSEVRKTFLEFFSGQHNHRIVPSSPVRLLSDPSLLFVNAGMNQFKPIFLGTADLDSPLRSLRRVANSQKCIRAGGKHNDLDDVGRDGYHHTFFEMLGNWSFADYFKKEACKMAWDLLTKHYNIPAERLYVTYFAGDPVMKLDADLECKEIWIEIGVCADRILPFGLRDNFWDMGETGPCGPCTEIHYNHTGDLQVSHLVNTGSPEVTEIWNLVFMQYERFTDKSLVSLPNKHVDTGMGLERLTALLNGSQSNYDTDLFQPLFDQLHQKSKVRPYRGLMGVSDSEGVDRAYRVVADHARMAAVSIADGIHPDILGPAQLVRKVIRRGALLARNVLKCPPGVVGSVAHQTAVILSEAFPDMTKHLTKISDVINKEEHEYIMQLEKGINVFEEMAAEARATKIFPGQDMFRLYYVCGLPEELIVDLISAHAMRPEMEEFQKLVNENKVRSKKAAVSRRKLYENFLSQEAAEVLTARQVAFTDDSGKYNFVESCSGVEVGSLTTSTVAALWSDGQFVDEMTVGKKGVVILDQTNFYSEAGGQPCDMGFITQEAGMFEVEDVQLLHGFVQHYGTVTNGSIQNSASSTTAVNQERRFACMRNHTATHILNEVLQQILGSSQPHSFYSGPDYLKMDFTLEERRLLTIEEIFKVERIVNDIIHQNLNVNKHVLTREEAINIPNLKMLEEESYPDKTSIICMPPTTSENVSFNSLEACCGTHVKSTKSISQFVITSHKAIVQTLKRLRAVTGTEAIKVLSLANELTNELQVLKTRYDELVTGMPEGEIREEDLKDIDKGIRNIRTTMRDEATPYATPITLEPELELLQRLITRRLRKKVKPKAARKQILQE